SQLMPKIEERESLSPRCQGKKVKLAGGDSYPSAARLYGTDGRVFVAYTVMPDGSSRNPRIFYAVPTEVFDRTVRGDIMHLRSQPDASAAPTECHVMYNFSIVGNDLARLKDYAHELKTKADSGDMQAAFDYGLLAAAFPGQLHTNMSDAVPWFLKAAQTGAPTAQFVLGNSLLFGWGCRCEEAKAEVWLRSAAAAGASRGPSVRPQNSNGISAP
ncbi:MAG TPA: energy transducer TonB, partial [Steroidobacteraceae bacterium]|nr:energy transducer TonB [Steroidobacteraceae bacterium]